MKVKVAKLFTVTVTVTVVIHGNSQVQVIHGNSRD